MFQIARGRQTVTFSWLRPCLIYLSAETDSCPGKAPDESHLELMVQELIRYFRFTLIMYCSQNTIKDHKTFHHPPLLWLCVPWLLHYVDNNACPMTCITLVLCTCVMHMRLSLHHALLWLYVPLRHTQFRSCVPLFRALNCWCVALCRALSFLYIFLRITRFFNFAMFYFLRIDKKNNKFHL